MKTGLLPSCWGPLLWTYCHSIAYVYDPEVDREHYYNFFKELGHILPCEECREHYYDNFDDQELNNALDSNESLFRWVFDLHNKVNEQLEVPESKWPDYEAVRQRYSMYKSDCTKVPGMCSQSETGPSKKIIVVEQFGTFNDEQMPFLVSTIVLLILLIIALLYIYFYKTQVHGKKIGRS